MLAYANEAQPIYALVPTVPPGIGKTHAAVRLAIQLARAGRRVLYAGPRHALYNDVLVEADKINPDSIAWFYEWLPRDEHTCRYHQQIATWLARGFDGASFCLGVCGLRPGDVDTPCDYLEQYHVPQPIIYGQHQHVALSHPFTFHMVIGDEVPIGAFLHEQVIPAHHILPSKRFPEHRELWALLARLQELAQTGTTVAEGPELLMVIGGADAVRRIIEPWAAPGAASSLTEPERMNREKLDYMENLDYDYLEQFLPLLYREACAACLGRDYPHRIVVGKHKLLLLLRHRLSRRTATTHLMWLDGTGTKRIYEALLGRPVEVFSPRIEMKGRIFQIHDRANGKGTLLREEADGEPTPTAKLTQLVKVAKKIVQDQGYQRVGVITHQAAEPPFREFADVGHFYGERGTNRFEDVDALIVAGSPQPPLFQLEKMAKMIFFERMEPFTTAWSTVEKSYNYVAEDGKGRTYPMAGFWSDPELSAVLWQLREAEIIQAAHRARLNIRDVDVWLLENLPIWDLSLTELLSMREVMGAPLGVDVFQWEQVEALAELYLQERLPLYSADLVRELGISRPSAIKYLSHLVNSQPERWQWPDDAHILPIRGEGKPAKGIVPRRGQGSM